MITAAIDGLAAFISGERHYFSTRYRHEAPEPTYPPETLDLDHNPGSSPEELAPYQRKD